MPDAESPNPDPHAARSALGASLRADHDALRNDLEQAKELAADFQGQLAGKSNEVAHLKHVLQRTQDDFNRLESHIEELRRERHRLANEAMRATALESQLAGAHKEIERLKEQLQTLGAAGGKRVEELLVVNEEQQREIARMRAAVEFLKRRNGAPAGAAPQVQQQINELTATVKRLQSKLDGNDGKPRSSEFADANLDPDIINLSFDR